MNTYKPPADGHFSAEFTKQILNKLKANFAEKCRHVHESLQKEEGHQEMKWSGVSDTIRRFVLGVYERDKIPVYIVEAVQNIEDPKWKSFFTQRLIVKHNHRTVQRCIDAHRPTHAIPELLDMEGRALPSHVPKQPKSQEFFDTITVPHEDIPGEQLPAPAQPEQAPRELAPAHAEEPRPQAAAAAPEQRQVREQWPAYGSPAEMKQRWARVQARRVRPSKRPADKAASAPRKRSQRKTANNKKRG
jgi:hypothetical protein